MKLDRAALEAPRSLDEMEALLHVFINDREKIADSDIYRRVGVVKDLIEEYLPLVTFSRTILNFSSANLTAPSHAGPDAFVKLSNGEVLGVQITTAGENYTTSLHRELLARGSVVYPKQNAIRSRIDNGIHVSGRILSTKSSNTDRVVLDVISAIQKKRKTYRAGTQILLISVRDSSITLVDNWQQVLLVALSDVCVAPYENVSLVLSGACLKLN